MKYEVAYISASGNTEKLAHGIADALPISETFVTDLSCEELTDAAETYLIGFGMKHHAIPLKIMEVLEELEGKTIMLFVTASVEPTDEHIKEIEQKLAPFMPEECNYKGLYLCPGQVSEETLNKVKTMLEHDPENEHALSAMEHCNKTMGRPNQTDIKNAQTFFLEHLELN